MDKKFWFQLFGLTIVILVTTFLAFNYKYVEPFTAQFIKSGKPKPSQVQITKNLKIVDTNGNTKAELKVEVADTDAKRSKGLGFRDLLASDSGMLFSHSPPSKYIYWMKGMRFPIDFIWILDDVIVDIKPNVPPPIEGQPDETLERYGPITEINKILETNAGFVDKNNIAAGDKIILAQ